MTIATKGVLRCAQEQTHLVREIGHESFKNDTFMINNKKIIMITPNFTKFLRARLLVGGAIVNSINTRW
jgi:hypothetical protein